MKNDFCYHLPVNLIFGPGKIETLGKEAAKYGDKVMIVTGRGSTKRSGLLDRAKKLLAPVGFGRVSITTADKHDQRIAFTSQMAHVISNAYIKSPTAREHDGFSAGSYKDLTRVAWLNPSMWAELFLENKKNLLFELDTLIGNLNQYKQALEDEDFPTLCRLLDEGRRIKEEVDGK